MTDDATIEAQLAELRGVLEADGYGLEADGIGEAGLNLRIVVTSPEACAECLVPKPLMREVISARLAPCGLQLGELSYPAELEAH